MQLVKPIGTFILHTAYITSSREIFHHKLSHNRNPFDRGRHFETYSQLPSSNDVPLETFKDSDLPSILKVKLQPIKPSNESKINKNPSKDKDMNKNNVLEMNNVDVLSHKQNIDIKREYVDNFNGRSISNMNNKLNENNQNLQNEDLAKLTDLNDLTNIMSTNSSTDVKNLKSLMNSTEFTDTASFTGTTSSTDFIGSTDSTNSSNFTGSTNSSNSSNFTGSPGHINLMNITDLTDPSYSTNISGSNSNIAHSTYSDSYGYQVNYKNGSKEYIDQRYTHKDDLLNPVKYSEYKRLKYECFRLKQELKKKESTFDKENYRIKKKKLYEPIEVRIGLRIQERDLLTKCNYFKKKAIKGYPLVFTIKTNGEPDEYELAAEGIFNKAKTFLEGICTTTGKIQKSKTNISLYFKPINKPKEDEDEEDNIIEEISRYNKDNSKEYEDNSNTYKNNNNNDNYSNYSYTGDYNNQGYQDQNLQRFQQMNDRSDYYNQQGQQSYSQPQRYQNDSNNRNYDNRNNYSNIKYNNINNNMNRKTNFNYSTDIQTNPNDNYLNPYSNPNSYYNNNNTENTNMNNNMSNNNNQGYYDNNYYLSNPNQGYQNMDNINRNYNNYYNNQNRYLRDGDVDSNIYNINSSYRPNNTTSNNRNNNSNIDNRMNRATRGDQNQSTSHIDSSRLVDQNISKDTDSRWIVKNKPNEQINQVFRDSQGSFIAEPFNPTTGQGYNYSQRMVGNLSSSSSGSSRSTYQPVNKPSNERFSHSNIPSGQSIKPPNVTTIGLNTLMQPMSSTNTTNANSTTEDSTHTLNEPSPIGNGSSSKWKVLNKKI